MIHAAIYLIGCATCLGLGVVLLAWLVLIVGDALARWCGEGEM